MVSAGNRRRRIQSRAARLPGGCARSASGRGCNVFACAALATANPSLPGSITSSTTASNDCLFFQQAIECSSPSPRFDGVAFGFEVEPQAIGEVRFVFDDQDAAHTVVNPRQSRVEGAAAPLPSLSAKHLRRAAGRQIAR